MTIIDRLRPARGWLALAGTAVAAGTLGLIIGLAAAGATTPTITAAPTPERTRVVIVDQTEQERTELNARETALDARENGLEVRQNELDEREAGLDDREDEIAGAEAQVAETTIFTGTWTVGVDIEPGTYRASDVSSDCYWAITRTGSNGQDIITNDLPGGGNPTVTLSEGQDFETVRCGEWTKQ